MAPTKAVTLDIDGQAVSVSNPDKVFFAEAGVTKLDLVRYYLSVADGALRGVRDRPMALKRFPNGAGGDFFFQKRAPANLPPFVRTVELAFPSGRTADEVVVSNAAALAWVREPGLRGPQPAPGPRRRSGPPRRAADRSRPRARGGLGRCARGRAGLPRAVRGAGLRRVAQDLGLARDARLRPARASLVVWRGPTGGAGRRARGGTSGAGAGHQQVVEGGAPRRVPRLQPERQGPDGGVGVLGPATPRCPRLDPTDLGRGARLRRGRLHGRRPCRPGSRSWATSGAGIDDRAFSLEPLLELVARHEAEGEGDAPWPPNYAKQPGEPPRVQPSKRRKDADRSGCEAERRSTRRFPPRPAAAARPPRWWWSPRPPPSPRSRTASSGGRSGTTKVVPHLAVDDVLYDAMRGRSTVWWRVRVNLRHVPEKDRPKPEPPDPDYDPWAGFEWPDRSGQPERAPRKKPPARLSRGVSLGPGAR